MPVISIITPVHAATATFLGEAYHSLAVQQLPPDWKMEWLVQADGPVDLKYLPDEPWISTDTGRPGGAARARTLALARATGVLLRQLDADDLLPDPLALSRDIHTLINNPTIAWVVSPCLDLLADGSTAPGPYDPAPGLIPPRTLLEGLLAERFPVMGTTVTLYTELARALGAWPALPYGQDVALCLNAEAVSAGWMQEQPGELYRQHPGQATLLRPAEERWIGLKALADQAQALHRTGWAYHPPVEDLHEDPGHGWDEDWLRYPPIAS
ncbi:GltA [Streptomyces sp. NBC_01142]|uniref:GltA n=1 Tax=Streptomyces sp. NBC_01142 TaxID=2975865 RepID=UPI00224FA743|nr:GltA [Streptomyces sp. NBC_01142]MCX4827029.1 GltA [Streptomyces sp. NBC_01142]